jgi:hypothetical protein
VSYPFSVLYHFLPWGILALLLLHKGVFQKIKKQPFVCYLSLVFLANIVIYWISPEVFPRYILMLIPLLFGVFTFLYFGHKKENTRMVRIVESIFGGLLGLSLAASAVPFFIDLPEETQSLSGILIACTLFLAGLNFLYWKNSENRLYHLVLALLILKISFNLVVIPLRVADSEEVDARDQFREIAAMTMNNELKFYWNPDFEPDPYYGYRITSYRANYYLCHFREKVIPVVMEIGDDPEDFYITKRSLVDEEKIEIIQIFQPPGHPSELVMFRRESAREP